MTSKKFEVKRTAMRASCNLLGLVFTIQAQIHGFYPHSNTQMSIIGFHGFVGYIQSHTEN